MSTPNNKTADLAYWISERESIRLRRAANMPPPWTPDPIMAGTRFTNVHREDDKVTKYIRNAHVWSNPGMPVWPVLLARMLNNIPTLSVLESLVLQGDLDRIGHLLKARRLAGHRIFSGAYTISTCGQKVDKIDYVLGVVAAVKRIDDHGEWDYTRLYAFHNQLMQIKGLGSFLAAQVVADIKNIKGHDLYAAPDWYTWSAPGPGSLNGLTAYFGRTITEAEYHKAIEECWHEVRLLLPDYVLPLHRQDFQNCLCEFSKYVRVKAGGRARNRYAPPTQTPEVHAPHGVVRASADSDSGVDSTV